MIARHDLAESQRILSRLLLTVNVYLIFSYSNILCGPEIDLALAGLR